MEIRENVELKKHCSYGVGGPARYYAEPTSTSELSELITEFHEKDIPLFILGKGSNILMSDAGFDGAVINLSEMKEISISENTVTAQAGALLTKTVMKAVTLGLAGMEDLAGIPGTVGGGVLMNAGAYSQTISDTLVSVTWLDMESGEIITSPKEELTFSYRTSSFKNRSAVILSAQFSLTEGDPAALRETVMAIQEKRRAMQPLNFPSCGSVFKRPPGNYAGALIEAAGLKGFSVGGAQVSEKHANFIINQNHATAEDIRSCISEVRKAVHGHSGILLEPEVIFIGKFEHEIYTAEEIG